MQKYSPNWYIQQLGYTHTRTPRPNGTTHHKVFDCDGVMVLDNPTHEEAAELLEAAWHTQKT